MKRTSFTALLLLSLIGCSPDLGDFKHIAKEPSIMLTILTNKYSPPILSGGGNLLLAGTARETTPFPVKSYDATVYVDLTIDDKTVAENIRLRMKDGNATFVEDIPLLEITNSVPNIPVTVTVKHAKWIPYGKASVQILGQ